MNIPIILGTPLQGHQSAKAAKFVLKEVQMTGIKTELIDINYSPKKYNSLIKKADGLIIVSPEYNHSFPGELKILLDKAYDEYKRKPLGICGVSSGGFGGARMVEQLRLVAVELGLVNLQSAVYFSRIKEGINEKWQSEAVGKMLQDLIWFTEKLK